MRHKPLGRTGLFVSELCLGTMTFGGSCGIWGQGGQIGQLQQADPERLVVPPELRPRADACVAAMHPGWMFQRQGEYRRKQVQHAAAHTGAGR